MRKPVGVLPKKVAYTPRMRGVWWWAFGLGLLGCDREYPVAATYCDDWCEWMVAACPNPYDPAECVTDCERRRKDDAYPCVLEHEVLLDCIQTAFRAQQYCDNPPSSSACGAEREALRSCAAGGPEGIAGVECAVYCTNLQPFSSDCSWEESSACQDDCMRRGLGHAQCSAERDAASLCFYQGPPEPIACNVWQDDSAPCGLQRAALAACGVNAPQTRD